MDILCNDIPEAREGAKAQALSVLREKRRQYLAGKESLIIVAMYENAARYLGASQKELSEA